MATIYELKPRFQRLLRPLSNGLVALGARPNHVTVAALVLAGAHGLAIAIAPSNSLWLLLLPVSFFVRMALNAIDGMMAREHDLKTHAGALLNEAGDVAADAAMIAPLALVEPFPAPLVIAAVILAALTEIVGLAAVGIGATRRYDGPMGKSDRAFAFSLLALAAGARLEMGVWLVVAVSVIVALLFATVINRARKALGEAAT